MYTLLDREAKEAGLPLSWPPYCDLAKDQCPTLRWSAMSGSIRLACESASA